MTIRIFAGKNPTIPSSAYVDETAMVIGDVMLGENSSVWPMAVIRGDINSIRIGDNTNIQDASIIHVNHAGPFNLQGNPTHIGNEVTIGHRVTLHGCTISDLCLIGIGSIVMDNVLIETEVVLGAGSLVPPGKTLSSGYLWLGSPAKKVRPLTDEEKKFLRYSANYYATLQKRYAVTR